MNHILSWKLFLESKGNPDDLVNLFKITTLIEPGKRYNAYSVSESLDEKACITNHFSQVKTRIKNGNPPKEPKSTDPNADEIYFHHYVYRWLERSGSDIQNPEQYFEVTKVNRKRIVDDYTIIPRFEDQISDEKMLRNEANTLKKQLVKSDPDAFRHKVEFVGSDAVSMRNPPKPKISEEEIREKQKKEKKYRLNLESRVKMCDLFERGFVRFHEMGEGSDDSGSQFLYWSAIYEDLFNILKSGTFIWNISGKDTVITKQDNRNYKLNLSMNNPIQPQQLAEIEFDKSRKLIDKMNGFGEFAKDVKLFNLDSRSEIIDGRRVKILSNGTILVPVKGSVGDNNTHQLKFIDVDGNDMVISDFYQTEEQDGYMIKSDVDDGFIEEEDIQKILKFVDSKSNEINLPEYGLTIQKLQRFIYRTITSESQELYNFFMQSYLFWKNGFCKKIAGPRENAPSENEDAGNE